jgi:DNA-binding NarL/FixJ family response regulator
LKGIKKDFTKAGAMQEKFRLVIAEDYTIVRQGLKSLLESYSDFEVVGEAEDGKEAIESVMRLQPDLVLMDLSMPNTDGITAIKEIKRRLQQTRILALTVHKTEGHVRTALEAGADGYILKDASCTELEMAIRNILAGKSYLSPAISDGIIRGYLAGANAAKTATITGSLTPREVEVLKLIAEGYRSRDIADYLSISINTVDKHRANLMRKLDLHSASALTHFALKEGLVGE